MGMTMTQKILARHAGLEHVVPGQLVEGKLDLVLGNDITTPVAIAEFNKAGLTQVFDREKIALVLDHYTPCKDIKAAQLCAQVREFAKRFDITHFYDVGCMGVEHALLPEQGLTAPGEAMIGADSHTCTYGAVNMFSTGVGSTDMAAGMATGLAWFRIPSAIKITLKGKLQPCVSGKDVILHLIGTIGVDGALYKSLEFGGEGVASLSMDDRFTIANMAIEAGAKNGIFPVDDKTRAYLDGRVTRPWEAVEPDADAEYEREVGIDLDTLQPTVALPHLPSNTRTVDQAAGTHIDQVVIGSCTNGRLEDLRQAAAVLKGRKVAAGVRCIVIPATQQITLDAMAEGLIQTFIEAGCAVSTPTCGPCLGGHMGVLSDGERAISTTNRNFVGRMGPVSSEIILANPAVAAASAVAGCVADPRKRCWRCKAMKVYKYGDNVDTDVIIPARYLNAPDEKSLASHCMEDIDAGFASTVEPGDIIVAGANFGCGSSREHAPLAIKACGVKCVIAPSFARIFYRNAITIGFPILECAEAAEGIQAGDTVSVDFGTGVITDETTGKTYQAAPLPAFVQGIVDNGGLLKSLKARGAAK